MNLFSRVKNNILPPENKIHIFSPPCNILYVCARQLTRCKIIIPDSKTMAQLIKRTGQQLNKEDSNRKEDLLASSLGTIKTTAGDSTIGKNPYTPMKFCCPLYPNSGKFRSLSSTVLLTSLWSRFSLGRFTSFAMRWTTVVPCSWHRWQQEGTMFSMMNGNMPSDWLLRSM